jgi:hypothetical protein
VLAAACGGNLMYVLVQKSRVRRICSCCDKWIERGSSYYAQMRVAGLKYLAERTLIRRRRTGQFHECCVPNCEPRGWQTD